MALLDISEKFWKSENHSLSAGVYSSGYIRIFYCGKVASLFAYSGLELVGLVIPT